MSAKCVQVSVEYMNSWISENPLLFIESVNNFLDEHPKKKWSITISNYPSKHYITITARLK